MPDRPFKGLARTLADFHAWALGDLTSPTTKGMIAEYLVRCSIEGEPGPVLEWDGVDIRTPAGTIEVKSASALSGGPVRKVVRPKFGIQMSGIPWDAVNNVWGTHDGTRRHADIYVFCLHAAIDPTTADPLDVAAMEVVPPGLREEAVVARPTTPSPEPRMDVHENARTTHHSRMLIVQRLASGWSVAAVAAAQGITPKTVRKWRDRHAAEGEAGLLDGSSRPHRSPARLDSTAEDAIEALRRQRLSGPAIARKLGQPTSTVGQVLRRRSLGRLSALQPRQPAIRYEREQPGELIHIDIKKLGRIDGIGHRITGDRTGQSNRRAAGKGLGWEYLHVAIDDRSRLAFTQLLPSEKQEDATAFLESSLAWFKQHGVTVQRVMTDNGSAYKSKLFAAALHRHGIAHKRTRPYTPKTNGKAERFIQSSICEWAYATPFNSSAERKDAMHPWLHDYNTKRPHSALGGKPPITRLTRDNVLGSDT